MHDLSYIDTTSGPFDIACKTLHSVPQACGCSIENILEYILNLSRCPGMSAQSKIKIRWHSNHCSHLISKIGNSVENVYCTDNCIDMVQLHFSLENVIKHKLCNDSVAWLISLHTNIQIIFFSCQFCGTAADSLKTNRQEKRKHFSACQKVILLLNLNLNNWWRTTVLQTQELNWDTLPIGLPLELILAATSGKSHTQTHAFMSDLCAF